MNTQTKKRKPYAISLSAVKRLKKKGIKNLAEAIILQSLEDIWAPEYKKESRRFFSGTGFKICSEIAELDTIKQFRVLHLLGGKDNGRNARVH